MSYFWQILILDSVSLTYIQTFQSHFVYQCSSQSIQIVDGKCYKFKKDPNGSPSSPPINESLLIYPRSVVSMPFGHVTGQNYYFYYWLSNYSRQIPYVWKNGGYSIENC
jgi:hypothetical protein